MFQELMQTMQEDIIRYIYRVEIAAEPEDHLEGSRENISPNGEGTVPLADQPRVEKPIEKDSWGATMSVLVVVVKSIKNIYCQE